MIITEGIRVTLALYIVTVQGVGIRTVTCSEWFTYLYHFDQFSTTLSDYLVIDVLSVESAIFVLLNYSNIYMTGSCIPKR